MDSQTYPRSYIMTRRILYYVFNLFEALLVLRLAFRAFGANPAATFTRFLYDLTRPLVSPFSGIFSSFSNAAITIEWATVVAMLVYALGFVLLAQLLRILVPPAPHEHHF